jgi:exopolysaccharide biosynthesis polyprenyl glycosylphosphotransferase
MLIVTDAILAGFCFFGAYAVCNCFIGIYSIETYLWILPVTMVLWVVLLYFSDMYASFRLKKLNEIVFVILRCGFISFLIFTSLGFLFKAAYVSRSLILLIFIFSSVALVIERVVLIYMFRELRRRGFNFRNILIVGTGKRTQRFIEEVDHNQEVGLRIIGLVDVDPIHLSQEIHGHRVIGTINDIPKIIEAHSVDIVVFIVPRSWLNQIEQAILYCETVGIQASVAMDFFKMDFAQAQESNMFGFPLLTFDRTGHQPGYLLLKRIIDFVLSFVALIILSPLLGVIAILVKTTSPGGVLFKQQRCGLNGRVFTLYKFRTMVSDAEAQLETLRRHNLMEGPAFKMENDPRVTKVGWFLRKFSLDELPQLLNVLKGQMSLVGPRPPLPQEVKQYDQWQRRRLSMRPGITCFWQINGRNKITDFNKWAKLDLEYIDHWSLWLDIVILVKTIPVVLLTRGAK